MLIHVMYCWVSPKHANILFGAFDWVLNLTCTGWSLMKDSFFLGLECPCCFIHISFDFLYFIVAWFVQRCVVWWICSSVTSGWPGHSGFPWKKLAIEKGVAIYGVYVMLRQSVQRYGYEFVVAPLRFQFTIKRCISMYIRWWSRVYM